MSIEKQDGSVDDLPAGLGFYLKDGHLVVQNRDQDIAVYAPGEWRRAMRIDKIALPPT